MNRKTTAPSAEREQTRVELSVVCPFYNEEAIIGAAVGTMIERLRAMDIAWELLVVNDGSSDAGPEVVRAMARSEPSLVLIEYPVNRGRGYALRQGIERARGDVIVTTEVDLSWGEDIVERLLEVMRGHPDCDMVVASPNLPGGGYKNVPLRRVLISRFGNWVIRACMTNAVTMNTGMTRAYRRELIQSMPLEENGKEFHLEVILKAQAFRYRVYEIPCVLEWKEYKHRGRRVKRKSSSRVNRLIVSHTLFSLFGNPIRYVWGLSAAAALFSLGFLALGTYLFFTGKTSVFSLIISLSFGLIALVFFAMGVLAYQGHSIQRELWTLKRDLLNRRDEQAGEPPRAALAHRGEVPGRRGRR